jgi:DNA-binding YbaB/EbfC family protein
MTDGTTGSFDLSSLLGQALELAQGLAAAHDEAANASLVGSAGGGKVAVTITGTGEVTAVRIDPSVVDPADVEMLEDLVLAALRDAANAVLTWTEEHMAGELGGLAGMLGGAFGGTAVDAAAIDATASLRPPEDPE